MNGRRCGRSPTRRSRRRQPLSTPPTSLTRSSTPTGTGTGSRPAIPPTSRMSGRSPPITVPAIVIDPTEDPLDAPRAPAEHARHFPDLADYRQTATGHNVPHEDPAGFADAIRAFHRM